MDELNQPQPVGARKQIARPPSRTAHRFAVATNTCLLGDSFTEVKIHRSRLVLGWVSTGEDEGAVNLVPFVGVDLKSATDRPSTRCRGNTHVK